MKLMDFLRSGATDTVALEANAAAASGAAGRPGKKDLGEHKVRPSCRRWLWSLGCLGRAGGRVAVVSVVSVGG